MNWIIASGTCWMTERMLRARQVDRAYWQSIISELRELRQHDRFMPAGSLVSG